MPFCSSCGTELQLNTVYCPQCGVKRDQPVASFSTPSSFSFEKMFNKAAFWGGLLVIIGFFSPWASSGGVGYSGFDMIIDSIKTIKHAGEYKFFFIIVPIALGAMGIAGLLAFLSSFSAKTEISELKNVPIGAIIVIAVLVWIMVKKLARIFGIDPSDIKWSEIFNYLGAGFYIALVGAIVLAASDD